MLGTHLYPRGVTRISKLHSYLKASLVSQSLGRIELRSAAGRQHPEDDAHRHGNTEGHQDRRHGEGNVGERGDGWDGAADGIGEKSHAQRDGDTYQNADDTAG